MAQKFPYVFIDESQDTFPSVVDALKAVADEPECAVSLGFFGDPMQQIYATGIGAVTPESGWVTIEKPENFRSSPRVLEVINRIRLEVPGSIPQVLGRADHAGGAAGTPPGTADLFLVPRDDVREQHLKTVQNWLQARDGEGTWRGDSDTKFFRTLVIEHRLAARRLGYEELYSAFHQSKSPELDEWLSEGTGWPIIPFTTYLLPLASAVRTGNQYLKAQLVRKFGQLDIALEGSNDIGATLREFDTAADRLAMMIAPDSEDSVGEVLTHCVETSLLSLSDEFLAFWPWEEPASNENPDRNDIEIPETLAVRDFLAVPARQLLAYEKYLTQQSPFATHHGVKGDEFDRVMVVLEDDAARGKFFSYDKLLGLKDLSETDRENIASARDSIVDKTRRLLYVTCSRAQLSLCVVLFTDSTDVALERMELRGLFKSDSTHVVDVSGGVSAK